MANLNKGGTWFNHRVNPNMFLNRTSGGPSYHIPWWLELIKYLVILGITIGSIVYLISLA